MIDVGDSRGASQGSEEMDWEMLCKDENESSISNSVASKKNRKAGKSDRSRNNDDDGAANKEEEEELVPSLRLECTEGPHEGAEVKLTDTQTLSWLPVLPYPATATATLSWLPMASYTWTHRIDFPLTSEVEVKLVFTSTFSNPARTQNE